jgi:bacterioferritin-associated ferredoxin
MSAGNIPTLTSLCQQKLLDFLELKDFHPKLINDLCKKLPSSLLEFILGTLLERQAITDVALNLFLVPDRTKLMMRGAVSIRNATLKQIGLNCPNLRQLNLSDCVQVSNSVVRAILQGCPLLNDLFLDRCHRVTDAAFDVSQSPFEPLVGCLSLESISMQGCPQVTGSAVVTLNKQCKRLKFLNLSQCKHIESPAIQELFEHHDLVSLNLSFVDGVCDEAFKSFPMLDSYSVRQYSPRGMIGIDGGMGSRSPRSTLRQLDLGKSSITDLSIFRMAFLGELTEIKLQFCNGITDAGIEALSRYCPLLRLIDLKSCSITDASLQAIAANCRDLDSLDVSWCAGITDEGIEMLVRLSASAAQAMLADSQETYRELKGLQKLVIVWCPNLTDATCVHLTGLSSLKRLQADGCLNMTKSGEGVQCLRDLGVDVTL